MTDETVHYKAAKIGVVCGSSPARHTTQKPFLVSCKRCRRWLKQQAPNRKRMLALDDELLAQAARVIAARKFHRPSQSEVLGTAVQEYLPTILKLLLEAGLEQRPDEPRKLRSIDDKAWDALAEAARTVALSQVGLLRACVILLARGEPKS